MEYSYQKAQKTCQSARFGYFVERHGETCNISPMESALSDDGSEEDEDTNEEQGDKKPEEPAKENGEKTPNENTENGKPEETQDAKPVNLDGMAESDLSRPPSRSKEQDTLQTQPNPPPHGLPSQLPRCCPNPVHRCNHKSDDQRTLELALHSFAWGAPGGPSLLPSVQFSYRTPCVYDS